MGLDTIDIEDLANQFGDDFVSYYTNAAMAGAVGAAPWLAAGGSWLLPIIRDGIEWVIRYIGHNLGLIAFQFNTYAWTADQGKDYIVDVERVNNLPEDVSDGDWESAEVQRMHSFGNLWNLKR